jgi:tetrahydromethanopterin S-methyltransferase subunit D
MTSKTNLANGGSSFETTVSFVKVGGNTACLRSIGTGVGTGRHKTVGYNQGTVPTFALKN